MHDEIPMAGKLLTAQAWRTLLLASLVGALAAIFILLLLSRLGVSLWLRQLGRGVLADITRDVLSTRTFQMTGLMLYAAHFIPVKMAGLTAQTSVPVPGWVHLIPVLPLLVGGYVTVLLGRDAVAGHSWLGAAVAVPYSILLLLLMGLFTIEFNLLLVSVSVAPVWGAALLLLPLWGLVLGAAGGVLAGQE